MLARIGRRGENDNVCVIATDQRLVEQSFEAHLNDSGLEAVLLRVEFTE